MIDDGPKVNRLEAAIALSMEAVGDGVLCAGSFQRLSITAFDDANNDSWTLSDSSYEVSATPPIGLVKRGDGKLDAQSPVPGQPEYAGQPVTIRFKYLPPNDPGRPPPPPGATTELVLQQSLTCGEPTEIDLKGDDGAEGAEGDVGEDGKQGGDGKPARAVEAEAAAVEIGGQRGVLVIVRVVGEDGLQFAVLPPDASTLSLWTTGGSGGAGGRGGRGTPGYDDAGNCRPPGRGGDGGKGGNGGDAAPLSLRVSSSSLLARFSLLARGGEPGSAGAGGLGGAPCGDTKNDGRPGSEGQPGTKRGKDAKVTTTVVAAVKLGLINAYVAKHPTIQLIE